MSNEDSRIGGHRLIEKYFPLTVDKRALFDYLGEMYNLWNARLNLISRQDLPHLYVRHVLHSLSIAKVISFLPGTKILDVGTGGGFPTIPLAILFPQVQFHAIDSTGKKIQAVQSIVNELSLSNVTTEQIRAENLKGKYDFVLGRAIAQLPTFYKWVKDKISPNSLHPLENGILYLKGGDFQGELSQLSMPHSVYNIQDFFDDPFFETKKIVHIY